MTIQLRGSLENGRKVTIQVRGIMLCAGESINLDSQSYSGFCIDWDSHRTNLYTMPENWQFAQKEYRSLLRMQNGFAAYQEEGYSIVTAMDNINNQRQYEQVFHEAIKISTPLGLLKKAMEYSGVFISEGTDVHQGKNNFRGALHVCVDRSGAFANTLQLLHDKFVNNKKISVQYKQEGEAKQQYYVHEVIDSILVQENDPLWERGMYSGRLARGCISGIYSMQMCSNREIMVAELAYMMPHIMIVNPNKEKELCPASEVYTQLTDALWKAADDMEKKVRNLGYKRRDALALLLAESTKFRYAFAAAANVYAFYRIHSVCCIVYAGALYYAAYHVGWRGILSDLEGERDLDSVYRTMRVRFKNAFFVLTCAIAIGDTAVKAIYALICDCYHITRALCDVVTLRPASAVLSHLDATRVKPLIKLIVCVIPYFMICACGVETWIGIEELSSISKWRRNLALCAALKYVVSNENFAQSLIGKMLWEPLNLSTINYVFASTLVVLTSMRYVIDAELERNYLCDDILCGVKGVCDVFISIALCNESGCYDRVSNAVFNGLSALGR